MLYLIGLGLGDEKDITVNGLERVKKCYKIYLESYTSKLQCSVSSLEKFYGKKIIIADRGLVEKKAEDTILKDALKEKVAFLVIGDVFSATTHVDLYQRALEKGIAVEVVNNASILAAVGIVGLELYKYGRVISIPFNNKDVKSPVEFFNVNFKNNLHSLFLLDLDPMHGRFMGIKEGIDYLTARGVDENLLGIGCSGLGSKGFEIKAGKLKELKKHKFTKYPQCLIMPAEKMHFMEEDMVKKWL